MLGTGSIKPNSSRPFILGVSGGSGSGKTFFAKALQKHLGEESCAIIYQDNFYIDQSKKFDFDGGSVNFDHPDSLDFRLLAKHLVEIKSGMATNIPLYDFATHSRKQETCLITPRPVIIVDGILIFHAQEVRPHLDELIFFDTPEELRYARRFERDVKERGREPAGVKNQFEKQVKPMHDLFVEPSKRFAKTIVCDLGDFEEILEKFKSRFKFQ
jgi:uridine kinase